MMVIWGMQFSLLLWLFIHSNNINVLQMLHGVIWKVYVIKKIIGWHPLQKRNLIPHCGPLVPNNHEPQTLRFYSYMFSDTAVGIPKCEVIRAPPPEFLNSGAIVLRMVAMAWDWRNHTYLQPQLLLEYVSSEDKEVREWKPGSHCRLAGTHSKLQNNLGKISLSFGSYPNFIGSFCPPLHFQDTVPNT